MEPNWIVTTILSGVIGAIVPVIFKIVFCLFFRFKKNRIVGNWHVYEVTKCSNNTKFTKGICTIKHGLMHKYVVKMSNDELIYTGIAEVEENHLYFKLKNCNDANVRKETCWQRYDLKYDNYKCLCGLWLSNNYDNVTCCGISILSLDELSKDEVNLIISENYTSESSLLIYVERR